MFTPSNNGFYRIKIGSHDANPVAETITTDALQSKLTQAAAAFLRFAQTAYPNIFRQYLLPYLQEFGWEYLLHLQTK